jgi:hypothetical protein
MVFERHTPLRGAEILARAKEFFAERVPHNAAYPEEQGPTYLTLRGQGGEEIAIFVKESGDGGDTYIRASTLLFDQALDRFLSTLPAAGETVA